MLPMDYLTLGKRDGYKVCERKAGYGNSLMAKQNFAKPDFDINSSIISNRGRAEEYRGMDLNSKKNRRASIKVEA